MILDPNARMAEAVRLTRAGRLAEATALLQGVPQKQKSPEASEGFDREAMRTGFRGEQLIDAVSPRSGATHWTAPGAGAQRHTIPALSKGLAQPDMAEAMRGFLERLGKCGSGGGLREMAGDLPQNAKTYP